MSVPKPSILREFDLEYWQMRAALGYSIPNRIDKRWPNSVTRGNPHACGICGARQKNPHLFVKNYDEVRADATDLDLCAIYQAQGYEEYGWEPGPSHAQPHPGFQVFRKRKHCPCYAEAAAP